MVYCGKPSRGCQMCRTRRIKCDETKPTCLQCQKSRRQCPGYKDDFDLVFRNETQATERRARRSINSRKIKFQTGQRNRNEANDSALASGSGSQGELVPGSNAASLGSVPSSVTIPLEMQAFHYFLSNYVLVPQLGTTRGHLSYVLPLLKGEPGGTQLSTSFTAVALASFGNRPGASRLLLRARQEYTKALNYVNKSLQNPTTQKSDQTLASILLLGLYETITLRRPNLGSWGTHIEGAVMLIRMRGRKQLRHPIGKSLFIAVRSQMLINCMSASKAPDLGVEWWTRGAARGDVAHEVSRLNLLTCELRADVNQAMALMPRTPENFDKTLELIRRAQEIEQGFLDWEASLSDEWRFKTVAWADTIPDSDLSISEVYPGKVDTFADLFVASQWNMARVARLILSGIIIRCAAWICAPVDYRTTSHYAQASRLGIEMINDIVASIPYHLGWRGFRSNSEDKAVAGNISSFVCGQNDIGTGKSLGAYFLIWPVFTSVVSDFATDAQRKYIIGRMKYMTDIMGINGAAVLTQFQLRLPSMIVKRDLMCMFAAASRTPGAYAPKSSISPSGPTGPPSSASRSTSISTYKPAMHGSKTPSISTSPMTLKSSSISPTGPEVKEEEEEEILEAQAQIGPDYEKKKAEKEAFSRTYGPAIKETSGDNMEYLHPESGQGTRTVELTGTL